VNAIACRRTPQPTETLNGYFGDSTWTELAKNEGRASSGNIGLVVTGVGDPSGNWEFNPSSNTWGNYDQIAIVLKDGQVAVNGSIYWFAYLLDNETNPYTGTWEHPAGKELSYLSVWGTTGGVTVPEPATMLLLGSGFLGLAFLGRRKFKK